MTELISFMDTVKDKSQNTQKAYKVQYKKLHDLLGKEISEASQQKIIDVVKTEDKIASQQALLNIGILIRRIDKNSVVELEKLREKNKSLISKETKEKNVVLADTLPSYEALVEYTDYLWDKNQWTDYIINYLLLYYQVRNQDLLFDIVLRKKYTTANKDKNYIWIGDKKAVFIRNVYKTAGTYKQKINTITDKKFITAVKRVFACQKYSLECGVFIPTESQVGYYIQKATYKGLGEGNYIKIVLNHFRNDFDKIKEISLNRGTSIDTISEFYDIKNQ